MPTLADLHLKYDAVPPEEREAAKAGGHARLEYLRAKGAVNYWAREIERWTEAKARAAKVNSQYYTDAAESEIKYAKDRLQEAKARLARAEAAMQRKQAAE